MTTGPRIASRALLTALAAALLALLLTVAWPTRYRYDHLRRDGETYPVRVDRFTGRAEYFDGAWKSDGPAPQPSAPPLPAPRPPRNPGQYSPDNPFAPRS